MTVRMGALAAVAVAAVVALLLVSCSSSDDAKRVQELETTVAALAALPKGAEPTQTLIPPSPQPTELPSAEPIVTSLPDRINCNEVRGTAYRSPNERDWFLANCVPTAVPNLPASGEAPGLPLPPSGDSAISPQISAAVAVRLAESWSATNDSDVISSRCFSATWTVQADGGFWAVACEMRGTVASSKFFLFTVHVSADGDIVGGSFPDAPPDSTIAPVEDPPQPIVSNQRCAEELYDWAQSFYLSPVAKLLAETYCRVHPTALVGDSSFPISRDRCAEALYDYAISFFTNPLDEINIGLWC